MKIKNNFVRFVLLTLCMFAIVASVHAQSSKSQNLIKEIKAEFPGRQKEIAEKCGGASVVVDVNFVSFGDNYDALLRVPQLGLKEMSNGFRRFCTDSNDTSKPDAAKVKTLKSKVKSIVLKHVQTKEEKKVSLQSSGVLLIEMKFDQPLGGGINYIEIAKKLGEIL
jgi:hypothetical protein